MNWCRSLAALEPWKTVQVDNLVSGLVTDKYSFKCLPCLTCDESTMALIPLKVALYNEPGAGVLEFSAAVFQTQDIGRGLYKPGPPF